MTEPCANPVCDMPRARGRRRCAACACWYSRHGAERPEVRTRGGPRRCAEPDCDRVPRDRAWCALHYGRRRRAELRARQQAVEQIRAIRAPARTCPACGDGPALPCGLCAHCHRVLETLARSGGSTGAAVLRGAV